MNLQMNTSKYYLIYTLELNIINSYCIIIPSLLWDGITLLLFVLILRYHSYVLQYLMMRTVGNK